MACLAVGVGASTIASLVAPAPPVGLDPAFYQHVGWYVTEGAIPYVDVWDVNPPLTFAVAAGLAWLTGGDMGELLVLSALVTFAVVAASVLLAGWVAYRLTDDAWAAFAAGLVMLVVPELYVLPPYGIRSQYFALCFGLVSLALALEHRPLLAGAGAAIGAGFWQPAAGIGLLVVGMASSRQGWRGAISAFAGAGTVAALVALPFAATGALRPMLLETIVAPLYSQAPFTLLGRLSEVLLAFGYGIVTVPLALYGWLRILATRRAAWWIPAGGLLFGWQLLFVNMNGSLDALLWLVFVALGVAIAVDDARDRLVTPIPVGSTRVILGVLVLLVLAGPLWHLVPTAPGKPAVTDAHDRAQPELDPPISREEADVPAMRTIYWQQHRPATCHYRLSRTELRWIARTDAALDDTECGNEPLPL